MVLVGFGALPQLLLVAQEYKGTEIPSLFAGFRMKSFPDCNSNRLCSCVHLSIELILGGSCG